MHGFSPSLWLGRLALKSESNVRGRVNGQARHPRISAFTNDSCVSSLPKDADSIMISSAVSV